MHGHELIHQLAAVTLVGSGAFYLTVAWRVRKTALTLARPSAPAWRRADLRTVALVPLVGIAGILALGALAASIGPTDHVHALDRLANTLS